MKKIPVVATVRATYQFVFTHLGAIIAVIWLPMVLITVAGFFVMQRYYAVAADSLASNAYARMGPVILSVFFYLIANLLFTAMMCVPVVQLALGQRKEGVLVHFAFGPPEWRLFRAMIGLAAFLMLPLMIAATVVNLVLSAMPAGAGIAMPLAAAALLLMLAGVIFVGLRFVFLLPALAVSEDGPMLPRSWKLSAGNFWRILVIVLASLGPVTVLGMIGEVLLTSPDAMMSGFGASSAMAAAELHDVSVNMPIIQGISFLIAPLTLGLGCGASASAFLALRDGKAASEI